MLEQGQPGADGLNNVRQTHQERSAGFVLQQLLLQKNVEQIPTGRKLKNEGRTVMTPLGPPADASSFCHPSAQSLLTL